MTCEKNKIVKHAIPGKGMGTVTLGGKLSSRVQYNWPWMMIKSRMSSPGCVLACGNDVITAKRRDMRMARDFKAMAQSLNCGRWQFGNVLLAVQKFGDLYCKGREAYLAV